MRPRKVSPDLLKLQEEWDEKLKRSGFVDAENRKTGRLKRSAGSSTLRPSEARGTVPLAGRLSRMASQTSKEATAEYFRLAGVFLHEHPFTSDEDRRIWSAHAEGMSVRGISAALRVSYAQVERAVFRLRATMLKQPVPRWASESARTRWAAHDVKKPRRPGRDRDEGQK